MKGAKHTVLVEMYELADPSFLSELYAARSRHVTVQVLLDKDYDAGSGTRLRTRRSSRTTWRCTGPTRARSTTRRRSSWTRRPTSGPGNLTAEYYATTRDFWIVDTQPADVAAIAATFHTDWRGAPPTTGPRGVDLVWSPDAEPTFLAAIAHAHHTIALETEELSDSYVVDALVAAARRHVAVHVTMTDSSEWHAAFNQLVAAGAVVHVDHGEHPVYVHAKALCVDCTHGDPRDRDAARRLPEPVVPVARVQPGAEPRDLRTLAPRAHRRGAAR